MKFMFWRRSKSLIKENNQLRRELNTYRHAFETTAEDRDRLGAELNQLKGNTDDSADGKDLAPEAADGQPTIPSMFFVTTPKSGTAYLSRLFIEGFGLKYIFASFSGFPTDSLALGEVKRMSSGNCYSTSHLDPSIINLQMLDYFLGRFIVHIRDPRQALWSWIHYVDRLIEEGQEESLLRIAPMVPVKYKEWPFDKRLEWQTENHLPNLVHWIEAWLCVYDSRKYKILLCDYNDFVLDEKSYVDRVIAHFEIPASCFKNPNIEKTSKVHYRSGDPDEWKSKMPQNFIGRVNTLVPDTLLDRMKWKR